MCKWKTVNYTIKWNEKNLTDAFYLEYSRVVHNMNPMKDSFIYFCSVFFFNFDVLCLAEGKFIIFKAYKFLIWNIHKYIATYKYRDWSKVVRDPWKLLIAYQGYSWYLNTPLTKFYVNRIREGFLLMYFLCP